GGIILDLYGWRTALFLAGAPGILLALVILATVRETPQRRKRLSHASTARRAERINARHEMVASAREIFSVRSFRLITASGAFITFVNYSQAAFIASFLLRVHGGELAL